MKKLEKKRPDRLKKYYISFFPFGARSLHLFFCGEFSWLHFARVVMPCCATTTKPIETMMILSFLLSFLTTMNQLLLDD